MILNFEVNQLMEIDPEDLRVGMEALVEGEPRVVSGWEPETNTIYFVTPEEWERMERWIS